MQGTYAPKTRHCCSSPRLPPTPHRSAAQHRKPSLAQACEQSQDTTQLIWHHQPNCFDAGNLNTHPVVSPEPYPAGIDLQCAAPCSSNGKASPPARHPLPGPSQHPSRVVCAYIQLQHSETRLLFHHQAPIQLVATINIAHHNIPRSSTSKNRQATAQQASAWGAATSTERACAVGLLPSTANSPQLPLRLKPPPLPPPLPELRRCCCCCCCGCHIVAGTSISCLAVAAAAAA